jgi:ATP-citrate lyase alpha-subunit
MASVKNEAMRAAGIRVPRSFNDLPEIISGVHRELHAAGIIGDIVEPVMTPLPEDCQTALKAGRVRKGTHFTCTISDDRGEEATYAGIPISGVATPDTGYGIGDVITLLWFRRRYPQWASAFLETVIKTVADHGPAVSGAHNARVTARAGKDIISSLVTACSPSVRASAAPSTAPRSISGSASTRGCPPMSSSTTWPSRAWSFPASDTASSP